MSGPFFDECNEETCDEHINNQKLNLKLNGQATNEMGLKYLFNATVFHISHSTENLNGLVGNKPS